MIEIRPNQSVFQLLLSTFKIYFRFLFPIVSLGAVVFLPLSLTFDLLLFAFPNPLLLMLLYPIPYVAMLFFFFIVVGEASEACLGGGIALDKALLRVSIRGVGRYLGTEITAMLFIVMTGLILGLLIGYLTGLLVDATSLPLITAINISAGLLFLLIFYIWSHIIYVAPVVALERIYWIGAMCRSAKVARLSPWRALWNFLFFFFFLFLAPMFVQVIASSLLANTGSQMIGLAVSPWDMNTLALNVIGSLVTLLFTPLSAIFLTLSYYGIRLNSGDLTLRELTDIKTYEAA